MGGSCCKDVSTDSRSRRYLERERLQPRRSEKGKVGSPQHYFPLVAPPHSNGANHSNLPAAQPPTSHPQSLSSTHPKRALGGDHNYEHETKPSAVINVNTANVHELCALKGVTPQLANSIVDYRCTRGNFRSVADLANVPGITWPDGAFRCKHHSCCEKYLKMALSSPALAIVQYVGNFLVQKKKKILDSTNCVSSKSTESCPCTLYEFVWCHSSHCPCFAAVA